jgi:hypothetical protein
MYVDRKRSAMTLALLLALETAMFAWFFVSRRPLSSEQWALLEAQRPINRSPHDLSVCAGCIDFALARRALGGWDTIPGHLLQIANIPAVIAARKAFGDLQATSGGSSLSHSDAATAVFVAIVLVECLCGATMLGIRLRRARPSG